MKTSNDGAELDLGIVPDKTKECCAPSQCCPSDSDKPQYPELCFRGEHADLFRKKYGNCAPGDEYTMTLRCRVKASSDGESTYEKRVEMCVEAIIGDVVEEEAEEAKEETLAKQRRVAKKETAGAY